MNLRATTSASRPAAQFLNLLASWYWSPILRFALFRGIAIALIGLGMGATVLVATSVTALTFAVLLLASLTPFIIVIATNLVGDMKLLFVLLMLLEIPLSFDINIGFNEVISDANSVSGFNVSATTFCLLFLYIWWIAEIATGDTQRTPARYLLENQPLLAYVLAVIFSIFFAVAWFQTVVELNLLIQGVFVYLYLVYTVRTRNTVLAVTMVLIIGLLLQSIILIALHFIGATVELGPMSFTVWKDSRVAGTLGQPNSAGAYVSLMLMVTLSVFAMPLRWQYKWIAAGAFALGMVGLLLTLSRGAWLGFAMAASIFWLLASWRGWLNLLVPIIVLILAIPVVLYFHEMLIDRLFGDDRGSAESRLPLMLLALRMIREHGLFGVGANNFAYQLKQYVTPDLSLDWLTTVHNKYLLVWAETGIAGIVTFIWFLCETLRRGWQTWRAKDHFLSPLALGLTLGLVGWMIHMNFDLFHGRAEVQHMLVVSALLTALRSMPVDPTDA
jgi:O-antigen ligase